MAKYEYLIEIEPKVHSEPRVDLPRVNVKVESAMDLERRFVGLYTGENTEDQTLDFWDEIDLVCPEYDCQLDEIRQITKL